MWKFNSILKIVFLLMMKNACSCQCIDQSNKLLDERSKTIVEVQTISDIDEFIDLKGSDFIIEYKRKLIKIVRRIKGDYKHDFINVLNPNQNKCGINLNDQVSIVVFLTQESTIANVGICELKKAEDYKIRNAQNIKNNFK